jgi:hypothetical protein
MSHWQDKTKQFFSQSIEITKFSIWLQIIVVAHYLPGLAVCQNGLSYLCRLVTYSITLCPLSYYNYNKVNVYVSTFISEEEGCRSDAWYHHKCWTTEVRKVCRYQSKAVNRRTDNKIANKKKDRRINNGPLKKYTEN